MSRHSSRWLFMLGALAFSAGLLLGTARAADEAATLRGRVLDEEGAPVAGAHVMIDPGNPRGMVTGADGAFVLPYAGGELVVRCFGFRAWRRPVAPQGAERALEISLTSAIHPIAGLEVTALRRPARPADHTTPVSQISGEALWDQRSALPVLADRLRESPEVTTAGRDDYNAAPAVRGLARFRTVLLFDGVRIQSDREIGPTAGFLDPAMLERVEVVRGPGSVLYGSDAIGGVVSLRSYASDGASRGSWVETGWSSANHGFRSSSGSAFSVGGTRVAFSLAHAQAGDYALPGSSFPWGSDVRRAANSGFERSAGNARVTRGPVTYAAFYSLGSEIGRPAREVERFTVDREEHVIHSIRYRAGRPEAPAEAHLYLHPNRWRALVEEPRESGGLRRQTRNYSSTDWGALATKTAQRGSLSMLAGLQVDARSGVDIVRALEDFDAGGARTGAQRNHWVTGATTGSAGALAHAIFGAGGTRLQAGARIDRTWRQGLSGDEGRFVASGQAGLSRELAWGIVGSVNAATAFREPTVTELFFVGKRPAGFIEGNPSLAPERSYQLDAGLKGTVAAVSWSLSGFVTTLRDFITLETRSTGSVDTLRYANATRATLVGGSLEARTTRSWHGFAARASLDAIRGEDHSGVPLLDLHGPRGLLEILHSAPRFHSHLTWRGAFGHGRPGPGEVGTAGFGVLDVGTQIRLGATRVGLALQNVLDQEIYERGEPTAYPSPSRSLVMSVRVGF